MRYFLSLLIVLGVCAPCSTAAAQHEVLRALRAEALTAFQKEDYQTCIAIYEQILENEPGFAEAYYFLGMAHKQLGTSPEEVLWLFKTAVGIDPSYVQAYEEAAKIHYALKQFDEAEHYALKGLDVRPDYFKLDLLLGWVYLYGKSEPKNAIAHFEKVLQQQEIPNVYFGLGMSYFIANKKANVLDVITKLRMTGEEQLAKQLEDVVRDKRYTGPTSLIEDLMQPRKAGSVLVRDQPPPQPPVNAQAIRNLGAMKVRLSGQMATEGPTDKEAAEGRMDGDEASALERIRRMREIAGSRGRIRGNVTTSSQIPVPSSIQTTIQGAR